jgi:hypothetical protein
MAETGDSGSEKYATINAIRATSAAAKRFAKTKQQGKK